MDRVLDEQHYTILKTALGYLGLAWSREGVSCLRLPDSSKEKARDALLQSLDKRNIRAAEFSGTNYPAFIRELLQKIPAHLAGELQDFSQVPIADGVASPFFTKVYRYCQKKVACGRTITYGDLAKAVGRPGAARAVGMAMAKNRVPLIIPCHRVLGAQKTKRLVGFTAPGGVDTKAKLLSLEGAEF